MRQVLRDAIAFIVGRDDDAASHIGGGLVAREFLIVTSRQCLQHDLLLRESLRGGPLFVGADGGVAVDMDRLDAVGLLTVVSRRPGNQGR